MKNTLIVILTLTTLALGMACVLQWRRLDEQKIETVSLRGELEQQTRLNAELAAAEKSARAQQNEAVEQASRLAAQLQTRSGATKTTGATVSVADSISAAGKPDKQKENGFGNMFKKMMEDPDMKKMIRDQQRGVLDQLYNPLYKQLKLTAEETEQFKDLLSDNMMKSAEKASSLFGGDSATNGTEALATLSDNQKTFDETVRGFLGEGRYFQYQEYQQTVGERAQLNQFRLQNTGDNALTDQQTEQLLGFMRAERQTAATAAGQPVGSGTTDTAAMQAMMTGEGAEKLLLVQEAANQQVLNRAKGVLSSAQLDAFEKFQANQLKMMRMGMTMAQKFMATDKPAQP